MNYGTCARCEGEILDGTSKDGEYHKYVEDCVAYQHTLMRKLSLNLLQQQSLIDKLTEQLDKVANILTKINQQR